jgi:hypothetical protein
MYQPPNSIKGNNEAYKLYGEELRNAINKRMHSDIPNPDVFNSLLDQVWDGCIAEHTFRLWFTPALVAKHTARVNAEYIKRQKKANKLFDEIKQPWTEPEVKAPKTDAAANGWTIEKCDMHIEEMQRMIANKEYPKQLGEMLIRIPMKAKERLINAGQTE